jgi:hypothetical protein
MPFVDIRAPLAVMYLRRRIPFPRHVRHSEVREGCTGKLELQDQCGMLHKALNSAQAVESSRAA